jgi:flagellar assembly factor FliW
MGEVKPSPPSKEPEMPTFQTDRCGSLEYQKQDVIHFAEGLVGMPNLKNWLILDMDEGVPLKWLQSLDRADFGFPVAQPGFFMESYDPGLPDKTLKELGTPRPEDLAVLVITRIHPDGQKITGNMLSPLVIGTDSRLGVQWTSEDMSLSLQQEINYLKFGLAVDPESSENVPRITDAVEGFDSMVDNGESTVRPEAEEPEPAPEPAGV